MRKVLCIALVIGAWIALLGPTQAAGQCTSSDRSTGQAVGYNGIWLQFFNVPTGAMSSLRLGYGQWNHYSCNNGGFPGFSESAAGTGRNLNVRWHNGVNPANSSSCGYFQGLDIHLYTTAYLPDGSPVDCSSPDVLRDTFTHELGHALGLNDQYGGSCSNYMMSQANFVNGVYQPRSLTSAECALVAATYVTPQEQYEEECENQPTSCDTCDPQVVGCGSPIVLVLDDRELSFSSLEDGVLFDLNADGLPDQTGWTLPGRKLPFLALDRNENGIVDNGSELFGDSTPFYGSDAIAENGYDALAELDQILGDGDGYVTESDPFYSDLILWTDRNTNGVSDQNEIESLVEAGVVAIGYRYSAVAIADPHDNKVQFVSHAFVLDPSNRQIREVLSADVFFVIEEGTGD